MDSITALKGNLGLRSSPLSPSSSKLSTQYLVLDHMANHYKKISKAKSAIDSSPPKSMVTSQKARDNKRRKQFEQQGRSNSCTSLRRYTPTHSHYMSDDIYDENLWDEPEDEEDQLVQSIMRTTLQTRSTAEQDHQYNIEKTTRHHQHLHNSNAMLTTMQPLTGRSVVSNISRRSDISKAKVAACEGDILRKRSQSFTEPTKPFTPRTLKTDRKSKLSEYKYYTAPKQKRNQTVESEDQMKFTTGEATPSKPKAKPRISSQSFKPENSLLESDMFETLQTRNFDNYKDPNVPPLNITVDKDHLSWLEDQADKTKQRAQFSQRGTAMKVNETMDDDTF